MDKILKKYFKDKHVYFHSSDALAQIEGDSYLRFCKRGIYVELYIGGNNGEVCITVTDDSNKLDSLIKEIIY